MKPKLQTFWDTRCDSIQRYLGGFCFLNGFIITGTDHSIVESYLSSTKIYCKQGNACLNTDGSQTSPVIPKKKDKLWMEPIFNKLRLSYRNKKNCGPKSQIKCITDITSWLHVAVKNMCESLSTWLFSSPIILHQLNLFWLFWA